MKYSKKAGGKSLGMTPLSVKDLLIGLFIRRRKWAQAVIAAWMSEDIMVSPNRPLGILLSIGIIAWFVKMLRP